MGKCNHFNKTIYQIFLIKIVVRGFKQLFVVIDMLFGSQLVNSTAVLASAIRIINKNLSIILKVESGAEIVESIKNILSNGIPVMACLRLRTKPIYKYGIYQSCKGRCQVLKIIRDARLFEDEA